MRRKGNAVRRRTEPADDIFEDVARWLADMAPLQRRLDELVDAFEKRMLVKEEPMGRA